ncbi:LysR family transcriptional regulator [Enterocloster lavalensis]|uniref:DNA-binding transcriptional regulator, LysR family n=2 Tax=Enterocloster lavalensis TaxID=460384 RepID=A0A1I0DGQ9_9FIRM|nr:LysR family transcriptional regulator [Enterocloster lavalensis]MBS5603370.1 LysR family transcriptional regulator [Enterocloster asparagiformis]SET31272.1 DNA-binding transcriptional regulator, LysR family [Enterocloster lavalensis]
MTIENIGYILEVLKCGSISSAANKLFMSQPLLSQKIRNIEQELGIVIFNRYSTPISLTYAGEIFVKYAEEIIESKCNLCKEIEDINGGHSGRLRIGISTHRALYTLPQLLSEYRKEYPVVDVNIMDYSLTTFTDALLADQVDLAMISHGKINKNLEYTFLRRDKVILVGGMNTEIAQRFPVGETISIKQAENEKFVSVQEKFGFRMNQSEIFKAGGIDPEIVLETFNIDLACRLAIVSDFVSLCPEAHPLETEFLKKDSFYCYIKDQEYSRNFSICYRKGIFLPKYMRAFIEMAVKLYREP